MTNHPLRAEITEVGPHDDFQAKRAFIPTAQKIEFIDRLIDAGMPRIEATSFVSPRVVPQLADAEEVMRGVDRTRGAVLAALPSAIDGYRSPGACRCAWRPIGHARQIRIPGRRPRGGRRALGRERIGGNNPSNWNGLFSEETSVLATYSSAATLVFLSRIELRDPCRKTPCVVPSARHVRGDGPRFPSPAEIEKPSRSHIGGLSSAAYPRDWLQS